MEDNPHTKTDRSEKILDALADYIESAPGEELLEDARREGRDPEQIASHVKGVIVKAVQDHQKQAAATRDPENATVSTDDAEVDADTLFRVGDLVALRSAPTQILPVIEVMPGVGECRYRVFQNSVKATYYESQLQAPAVQADGRRVLAAREVQAHPDESANPLAIHCKPLLPAFRARSICAVSV